MQQRRLRLSDILDDYCSRERRITNHVVVAMIDEDVKQTRCTTCDTEHEYKAAKAPLRRRRPGDPVEGALRPRAVSETVESRDEGAGSDEASAKTFGASTLPHSAADAASDAEAQAESMSAASTDDGDGPVHRRLIRATLPRPEGQLPERKSPDFTIRQQGGRGGGEFDGNRAGQRPGQAHRPIRAQGGSQPSRFGGPRHDGSGGSRPGSGQGRPPGSRPGHPGGPRGNRPGQGAGRGGGRKHGR